MMGEGFMKQEIDMLFYGKTKKIGKPADMKGAGSIITDPDGSYTGAPVGGDVFEKPVQDVDDL